MVRSILVVEILLLYSINGFCLAANTNTGIGIGIAGNKLEFDAKACHN